VFLFEYEVLQFLRFVGKEKPGVPSHLYKCTADGLQPTFPNTEAIFKIFLTIPLANISGGRLLSAMKR
jgi:hypothetical protein